MKSGITRPAKIKPLSFWQEFCARSGFIGVVALTNPIFVTFYVMFLHNAPGGLQFWFVGLLLTAGICAISSLFMGMVVYAERRRRIDELKRQVMWHDLMPYDGKSSKAG
jgi:hypothetical protein